MTYPVQTFLAVLYTAIFLLVGIAVLKNRKSYEKILSDFSKSSVLVYLSGVFSLGLGVFTVLYNAGAGALVIIIEAIGWLAILKGAVRILFPEFSKGMIKKYSKRVLPMGWIVLLLGIVLLFLTYLV